jgi:hypothetical protein
MMKFPIYGKIIKMFQTTNQKSSRIARNPPSKCKNPIKNIILSDNDNDDFLHANTAT